MTSEEREARRLARAAAREKEERLAFWESLPEGERRRLCIWFARQFPSKDQPDDALKKKTENTSDDQLPTLDPVAPPNFSRIPKEKPPWWKR